MERQELICQLRSVKLDNGNPIQWVHLICEAAEMLERDDQQNCAGCVNLANPRNNPWCTICSRSHKDYYQPNPTPNTSARSPQKEKKGKPPAVSLGVYRQWVFDCAADMMSSNCDYEKIIHRLIDLADWPIKDN